MTEQPYQNVKVDVAIIGGGVAGLWLLNRLIGSGYNAVLFEQRALGSSQTVASQGMIHGGIKYTLSGSLTGASEAIADMPDHWQACLRGEGDVDLRGVDILSDHFYLWSSNTTLSKMTTFLASKATRGRVEKVKKKALPAIFQQPGFRGTVYKLVDIVLDVPKVVQKLAENCPGRTFQIDWNKASWQKDKDGTAALDFDHDGRTVRLNARQFVLTAGQGNEKMLADLEADSPKMQRRPLQQAMVKHNYPHTFYGHCLGAEKTPRLTISSHPCKDGSQVWYLGGSLAEDGVKQTSEEVIENAKKELSELMPWVDLKDAQWATLNVDRAEPQQKNLARPDQAFAEKAGNCANVIAAWPTKLTLSPNLADEVITLLKNSDIQPQSGDISSLNFLPPPPVSATPWDDAFPTWNGDA